MPTISLPAAARGAGPSELNTGSGMDRFFVYEICLSPIVETTPVLALPLAPNPPPRGMLRAHRGAEPRHPAVGGGSTGSKRCDHAPPSPLAARCEHRHLAA
jgi:hypothetical protein